MVRTLQTTRVNTSYAPQPRQIPVYPVVVEDAPANLPPVRVENVINLEDSSESSCRPPPRWPSPWPSQLGHRRQHRRHQPFKHLHLEATTPTTPETAMTRMTTTKTMEKTDTTTRKLTTPSRTTSWGLVLLSNIIHQCSRQGTSLTCCRMLCMRWEPTSDPHMRPGECASLLRLATTSLAFMSG